MYVNVETKKLKTIINAMIKAGCLGVQIDYKRGNDYVSFRTRSTTSWGGNGEPFRCIEIRMKLEAPYQNGEIFVCVDLATFKKAVGKIKDKIAQITVSDRAKPLVSIEDANFSSPVLLFEFPNADENTDKHYEEMGVVKFDTGALRCAKNHMAKTSERKDFDCVCVTGDKFIGCDEHALCCARFMTEEPLKLPIALIPGSVCDFACDVLGDEGLLKIYSLVNDKDPAEEQKTTPYAGMISDDSDSVRIDFILQRGTYPNFEKVISEKTDCFALIEVKKWLEVLSNLSKGMAVPAIKMGYASDAQKFIYTAKDCGAKRSHSEISAKQDHDMKGKPWSDACFNANCVIPYLKEIRNTYPVVTVETVEKGEIMVIKSPTETLVVMGMAW